VHILRRQSFEPPSAKLQVLDNCPRDDAHILNAARPLHRHFCQRQSHVESEFVDLIPALHQRELARLEQCVNSDDETGLQSG
jgi:hypothetical protein